MQQNEHSLDVNAFINTMLTQNVIDHIITAVSHTMIQEINAT